MLFLFGCSARSAAESAHRAGWSIRAWDQFADQDLQRIAHATSGDSLDSLLQEMLATLQIEQRAEQQSEQRAVGSDPCAAIVYVGGVENAPHWVKKLESTKLLAGVCSDDLLSLRDQRFLAGIAANSGMQIPRRRSSLTASSCEQEGGQWLWKPFASGGGQRIFTLPSHARSAPTDGYLQQYVAGTSWGATILIDCHGTAHWRGACRMLDATQWSAPGEFTYRGSLLIPAEMDAGKESVLELGKLLADKLAIRGLIQIDFVLDSDGVAWLLEVNPRWSASMELIERYEGCSLMAEHLAAYRIPSPKTPTSKVCDSNSCFLKAVLYSRAEHRFNASAANWIERFLKEDHPGIQWKKLADIPVMESLIPAHNPVMSLILQGASLERLMQVAQQADRDYSSVVSIPS